MAEFRLEDSLEYRKIRELRNIVISSVRGDNFSIAIHNAIPLIVSQMPGEAPPAAPVSTGENAAAPANPAEGPSESDMRKFYYEKRREYASIITRPELIEAELLNFKSKVSKSLYTVFAISNYAFAEPVFWLECESEELKKYRSTQVHEEAHITQSKKSRRKAEEEYKNRQIDEAVSEFMEAETKNPQDFTIHYQMALIFFFEKADYNNAMFWFRKASKNAYNRSTQVFVHSMVFLGLILRLRAQHQKNQELFSESYQAIAQAYNLDSGYSFSRYAMAQCMSHMTDRAEIFNQAKIILKDLIKNEKLFALQLIYDVAFDLFLEQIGDLYKNLSAETEGFIKNLFEKIEKTFEYLNNSKAYLPVPNQLGGFENIYHKYLEQFADKNYFEMVDLTTRIVSTLDELQQMIAETDKNKKFVEIKDIVEKIMAKYNEEIKLVMDPMIKAESRYNISKDELQKLNSSYPEPDFNIVAGRISPEFDDEEGHLKMGWRESGLFTIIKIISGSVLFMMVFLFIIIVSLFIESSILFIILCGFLNMLLIPLYGATCGEIFYNVIENRRRNIKNSIDSARNEMNSLRTRVDEAGNKISEKYVKFIAESTRLSAFTSEKIFEAAAEGHYEKIKSLI